MIYKIGAVIADPPEHSSSSSVFIEVHAAQPLFFYVLFCKSLFFFYLHHNMEVKTCLTITQCKRYKQFNEKLNDKGDKWMIIVL
jgi:hypothetical protein